MDAVWLTLRAVVAMAAVLGLIWWVARRAGGARFARGTDEPKVAVVDRTALGRHAGVAVLAVGSRRILVGFAEQQVSMLTELSPVIEPAGRPRVDGVPVQRDHGTAGTSSLAAELERFTTTSARRPVRAAGLPPDVDRTLKLSGPRSRRGGLHGSLLHPATWTDTVKALQDRTVRR